MVKRRPALDVESRNDAPGGPDGVNQRDLGDLIDAVIDDFRPFAIAVDPGVPTPHCPNPSRLARRRVFFFNANDRAQAAAAITTDFGRFVSVRPVDVVDDGDTWAARTQTGLRAIRAGRLVVAPPWDLPVEDARTVPIVIRPSMGFGTGHHATTRLCLFALQEHLTAQSTVTDIGTGSGVLAIAAAKLGAANVLALENDPDAVGCAKENVAVNGVRDLVAIQHDELGVAPAPRPASLVLANLTSGVLTRLARAITGAAIPEGTLILSGLAVDDIAGVTDAFASQARQLSSARDGDWVCLVFRTGLVPCNRNVLRKSRARRPAPG